MSKKFIMDNAYFRQEIHKYIDERYTEFEGFQRAVTDALIAFDSVCRRNNITYYVGFGSLLGIYRDGTILPWDYDIDVVVPITEQKKLILALKKDLDKRYYFYCPEVDKKCRHYCMRVIGKEYDSAAIHLDVFFLIGAPDDKKEREKFRNKIKKVNFIRKYKLVDGKKEAMGLRSNYIISIIKKIQYVLCPLFVLDNIEQSLCHKVDYKTAKYVTTMQAAADTYTSDVFKKPSEIEYDGKLFYAPTDIKKFFSQTYKDYTSYPPVQSRFDEFYMASKKIKYFHDGKLESKKMDFQVNVY